MTVPLTRVTVSLTSVTVPLTCVTVPLTSVTVPLTSVTVPCISGTDFAWTVLIQMAPHTRGLTVHWHINACINCHCTSVVSGKMAAKGSPASMHAAACQAKSFFCSIGRRISGDFLDILKELSRRGMNSSGKACHSLIAEASSRTGLSEQQVKVSQMLRNSA